MSKEPEPVFKVPNIQKYQRPLAVYKQNGDQYQVYTSRQGLEDDDKTYSGKLITMTKEEYKKAGCHYKPKYTFIKAATYDLEKEFNNLCKEAMEVRKVTKGKLNPFRTGCAAITTLVFFYDTLNNKGIEKPDPLEEWETAILRKCKLGPIRFSEKYEGKAYKYDVVSQYPSRMLEYRYPMKEGKLKTMTQEMIDEIVEDEDATFSYGIYSNIKIKSKSQLLLPTNDNNSYTHYEMNRAKELGYKIKLINEEPNNWLSYKGKTIDGEELFGDFVNYLYDLKNQGHKCVKPYLNALWGTLCQVDKLPTTLNNLRKTDVIDTMQMKWNAEENRFEVDPKLITVKIIKGGKTYKTDFARIHPFLMAQARLQISEFLEHNLDDVVYVHTDGFILKKKISKKIELGTNLGDLKFEGVCDDCKVPNCNGAKGNFSIIEFK